MAIPVMMPRQGQSVESCILVEWLVKPGDQVEEGQILGNYETDKAAFELESPAAGTILDLFFDAGADVPVLMNIAAIGEPGEDASLLRPSGGQSVEAPVAAAEVAPAGSAVPDSAAPAVPPPVAGPCAGVSPRARNLAKAECLSTTGIAGTGPGGRVIERDVKSALVSGPRMTSAARDAAVGGLAVPASGTGLGGMVVSGDLGSTMPAPAAAATGGEPTVVPMTGIRKIIAKRMHQSLATTAQLTATMSFDARSILGYREKVKASGEALGLPNITINDLIAFAAVRQLVRMPALNAHFLGDKIVQYPSVNLGVAMDTPRGLMVPVVPAAERLSLSQLSLAIKPMAEAARQGSINPDLLVGGTFTITNMGMMGVETFTPVLNTPEVAILGVGGIQLKPIETSKGIEHVRSITLSLTVDHQAVDGADGARFLQALTRSLADFELTLAG